MIFLEASVVEASFAIEWFSFLEASVNSVTVEGGSVGGQLGVTEVPVTTSFRGSLGADHRYGYALEKL